MLVAQHPDDENLRVVAQSKGNLARTHPSFAYSIDTAENGGARLSWRGVTHYTPEMLLQGPSSDDERGARDAAMEFLRDALSRDGLSSVIVVRKAHEANISKSTLERAKKSLGVVSKRHGFGKDSHTTWHLPIATQAPAIRIHAREDEYLWEEDEQNTASQGDKTLDIHPSSAVNIYGGRREDKKDHAAD